MIVEEVLRAIGVVGMSVLLVCMLSLYVILLGLYVLPDKTLGAIHRGLVRGARLFKEYVLGRDEVEGGCEL